MPIFMPDDIDSDYAAAGFNGSLPFGRSPAVIVIDVVMAYLDPASTLYLGPDNALPELARLTHAAQQDGHPGVLTHIYKTHGCREGALLILKVPERKPLYTQPTP